MDSFEYLEWLKKFEAKKTTDDCYTPPLVYDVVKNWAVREYGLLGRQVVRPFYPGGDYVNAHYPEHCVVIDNPPFSILSKIVRFYNECDVDYFLFAPHLTLFSCKTETNYVVTGSTIIYENKARIKNSFVTNLGSYIIRTAPELERELKTLRKKERKLNKYSYPSNVIRSTSVNVENNFFVKKDDVRFITHLFNKNSNKVKLFGGAFVDRSAKTEHSTEIETDLIQLFLE